MKKLLIILLAVCCSTEIFAQADPLIQNTLMSPNPLAVGQIGQLTTDVRNNGSVDITAGCAIVSISVPSTICGATLTLNTATSSPIWTVISSGSGFIDLKNTGGILPFGASSFPIVLNVSGDARGGPLTIQAVISLGFGCTGLGDIDPTNNIATTSLSVYGIYTWKGSTAATGTGDRWTNASNWTTNVAPLETDKAIIPVVSPNKLPKLFADAGIRDIQIDANATVELNSKNFTISGAVTGTGTLKGTPASNLIIDGNAGNIRFATGFNNLLGLTLKANAQASIATPLDITSFDNNFNFISGSIIVENGAILASNGNITLKSDGNGTAHVGSSAGTITGNVIIERYISNIGRKWRLLSGKTIASAQTIRNAWQENGAVVNNRGTWVTKPGGGSGYDGNSNTGSLLTYDANTESWNMAPMTNAGSLNDEQGYMLFVRGDRNALPSNALNDETVLRTTGTLNQHAQPAVLVPVANISSGYTLVGNPFASSLDFEKFHTTTNLKQDFYIWDASSTGFYGVGGYRLVSRDNFGSYSVTPNLGITDEESMRYISSGQAFFVGALGSNANVVLDESSKSDQTPEIRPIVAGTPDQQLFVNLFLVNPGGIVSPADGIRVRFDDSYSAGLLDDAEKISNFGENIASLRKNKLLVVERRPMIVSRDTIFLRTSNLKVKDYRLQLDSKYFVQPDATGYLEDLYLKTVTKLDLTGTTNTLDFSVTTDVKSADPDRFRIIFALKPATSITLTAAQQGNDIAVDWKASNQNKMKQYEVEKSTDGINFTKVDTKAATGIDGSTVNYNWVDVNPAAGDNYYRIHSTDLNALQKYTEAVKVNIKAGQPEITVYPNPVTNKMVYVKFANMYKGIYKFTIISSDGRMVYTKDINHNGGTTIHTLILSNMASANYRLEIIAPNKNKTNISINVLN